MFNFQAIILAAGCGTRMNLTTEKIPKCLLPIGKTTINSGKYDNKINLFIDPNQLSFVTVNLVRQNKESF